MESSPSLVQKKSMRRTASTKQMNKDTTTASQTHQTPISKAPEAKPHVEEPTSHAEAEMMRGLPKPKVATSEDHKMYSSICTYNEKLFGPVTSHLAIMGAPVATSVINSFHAGEVRTNLGKMTKKFAESVVSLFEEGPSYKTQFASQWSHMVSEMAQKTTFELQGFGVLFSYMFFQVVTGQAKFELVDDRVKELELELARLKKAKGMAATTEAECQTDVTGDVVRLSDMDCTPQKPQRGSRVSTMGLGIAGEAAGLTLEISTVTDGYDDNDEDGDPAMENGAAGGEATLQAKPPSQRGSLDGNRKPNPHLREAAIEKMLRKPSMTNRLAPVHRHYSVSDATLQKVRVGQPALGNATPRLGLAAAGNTSGHTTTKQLSPEKAKARAAAAAGHQEYGDEVEEVVSIFPPGPTSTGASKMPFPAVNGLSWKDFWNSKEKKKLQMKLGLSEPPQDFSDRDAASYGHHIIKIKDEFLGTTAPLSARIFRPMQPLIEERSSANDYM